VRVGEIRKFRTPTESCAQMRWLNADAEVLGCWKKAAGAAKMGEQRAARHLVTPLYMDAPLEKPLLFLQE
jgi:hypothetical protein